jgi:fumarate reductase flavoprotein subunit
LKSILLLIIASLILFGCSNNTIKYEDGTYYGKGEGHHGEIKVEVLVESSKIIEVEIVEDYEIPGLREIVFKEISNKIIKKNTWQVDDISGATLTSKGVKEAVENALNEVVIE